MSIGLDRAGSAHAELLAALHAECFKPPWSAEEFARLLAPAGAFGLIGSLGASPSGFALAWAQAGEAELISIGVAPHARRSGIGAALLRATLQEAAAHAAEVLFLEVAEGNAEARALYARLGFLEVGRRRNYYGGREDALVLRRATALVLDTARNAEHI